jgi:hypothetical protein
MKRYTRPMTALDAVFMSISDPRGAMQHLLVERKKPPFLVLALALITATILVPPLIFRYRNELVDLDPKLHYATAVTLALTFAFFVLLSTLMLRVLGVSASAIKVLAATVYSMVPVIPILLGFYLGSYFVTGNVAIIRHLMTGNQVTGDYFSPYFPATLKLIIFLCWLVYLQALRAMGSMSFLSAMFVTGLSAMLLAASGFIGLTVSQSFYPETGRQILQLLGSLFYVT